MHITDQALIDFEFPEGKNDVVAFDDEIRGFGCRIRKSGSKTFIYQYRNNKYVQRRITIGKFPSWSSSDARHEAKKLQREVSDGNDPAIKHFEKKQQRAEEKRKRESSITNKTLKFLIDQYLKARRTGENDVKILRPLTWFEAQRYLYKHASYLHSRKVSSIKRSDINDFTEKLACERGRSSKVVANRGLTHMRSKAYSRASGCPKCGDIGHAAI